MKLLRHITILAAAALISGLSASAQSILEITPNLHDTPIIYPESFETDTHKMLENWYLKNYAELDKEADSRASVQATDDELIERLGVMSTVIEMPFNSVVRNYIDMYTQRRRQLVENVLGMSLYYMPIFEEALDRHDVPLELKYLPVIESALNPNAVSKAGATGLWQFMKATGSNLGLEINSVVDQRRDPYASSDAAAAYLKQLHDYYDDWSLAIAAYNCGPGNVNKALRRAGGGKKDFWQIYPFLPAETRGYVPAFIAANYVMNFYSRHNISPALARKPLITDTIHVGKRVHFNQISEVLNIPVDEIRALNPQYRRDLIPGNIKPYTLTLPSMQVYAYLANEDSIVNHNAALYARREVVEPAKGITITGSDEKGEYIEEITVKYHTVKKGETLNSIAKKYGTTVKALRKSNKIGKSVRRGQKLKIETKTRQYIEPEPAKPDSTVSDSSIIIADSIAAANILLADSTGAVISESPDSVTIDSVPAAEPQIQEVPEPKPEVKPAPKPAPKPKTTIHKVTRGQNLSKIARRYGVTVDQIKKANNLTSDNISVGQRLKIPEK